MTGPRDTGGAGARPAHEPLFGRPRSAVLGAPGPLEAPVAREEPPVAAPRRRRRLLAGGALLAALALLAVTAVVAFRWGAAGTPGAAPTPAPSASAEAQQLTVAQIYQTLLPSVVFIQASGGGTGRGMSTATGTGVVANADGTILTALHVVAGATAIEVTFADGTRSSAEITGSDPANDIAALAAVTPPAVIVPAVLGGGAAVGDPVVAIGNQLGLATSTTSGVVSGLERTASRDDGPDLRGLIQFDAAVNPGSSGGPLINARGQTIGIVVALANPTDAGTFIGVGFAVPIGTAAGAGEGPPPQL